MARRTAVAKATILLVDDEDDLVETMGALLRDAGHRVLCARNAGAALASAARNAPDLILLDVMLPEMDGFELCRLLRQKTEAPILFVSARGNPTDKIVGLRIGGDDYLAKPFEPDELVARVAALLRRSRARLDGSPAARRIGRVTADFARHELRVDGRLRELTPKEFAVFRALAEAEGAVVSRAEILKRIWGVGDGVEEIDSRTVDQHVARIRRKLAPDSKRIITVPGYGYRLNLE